MHGIEHVFCGALTEKGFRTFFDLLVSPDSPFTVYIIKGSPGSGKSTVIKRVLAKLEQIGEWAFAVHCASDPSSLDGVICPNMNFAVIDGTAPHAVEPTVLSGKHRVVSLYRYMDISKLTPREKELHLLTASNADLLSKATTLSRAVCDLAQQYVRNAARALDRRRAAAAGESMAKRLVCGTGSGVSMTVYSGALTPLGYENFHEKNKLCFRTRVLISDNGCSAADELMSAFAKRAEKSGFGVTRGICPLTNTLDYVGIPTLSTALFANTQFSRRIDSGAKTVNAYRFYNTESLSETRANSTLCKRIAHMLEDETVKHLSKAKALHDKIEDIFKRSIDFDAQREESILLISELFGE